MLSDQRDQNAHTGWFSILRLIFFKKKCHLAVSSKDIAATGVRVAARDSLGKREKRKKTCVSERAPLWNYQ